MIIQEPDNTPKKKVLVIDDDEPMAISIARIFLQQNLYKIEIAYNGLEADEKFKSFEPDIIILDINMPVVDGFKLCYKFRQAELKNPPKILIISGDLNSEIQQRAEECGADDCLAKPFENQEIKDKVAELLGDA